MGQWDGDIIFRSPDKEFLRFKGDGTILVEGRESQLDGLVVMAFRHWLQSSLVRSPDGKSGNFCPPNGPLTFQSGHGVGPGGEGGNINMDSRPAGPLGVVCPYCKVSVGMICLDDPTELPVDHAGHVYHVSRMRLVGLWPRRG